MAAVNLQKADLVPLSSMMTARKVIIGISTSDVTVDVTLGTTGTYDLIAVPAGVFVHGITAHVDTACTSSVTMEIGDSDDTDGFFTDTDLGADTSDAAHTWNVGGGAYGLGKIYSAAQNIQAVVGGATVAAGQITLVITYSHLG